MKQIIDSFTSFTAEWFRHSFGKPTKVQEESWPAIREGRHVLVSAPTGTGKTLSAFLVFIDRLKADAAEGRLEERLYLIYVSPLKSLAADIRENLRRPLDEIAGMEQEQGGSAKVPGQEIVTAIRTGDTPQRDRQRMIKHPPHILIITPESLYLMLTSKTGREILKTAEAVILDELHALIDTKRGAHLMLSIARLDQLCHRPLQRIGLSATIEPLELAARYLAPEQVTVVAPVMDKRIEIEVVGTLPPGGRRKDPVWEELGREIYRQCQNYRSVIAFSEGRRYAEKVAFYVNELGGEGFARVHHGSLSKEQRMEVENSLREGKLRLLCATSSMELGIDVGEIDLVLQIGCPRSISSTMQRLGRAGHNPGRTSRMYMFPRTAPEGLSCGLTAYTARQGGVEYASPPQRCLDVLAQHLVSMAAGTGYGVEDVMEILPRAYPFREVTAEEVRSVLRMLAGDYEHDREIPVRPRVLYDRIHDTVSGDAYSRMLAVAAGGTIPDKGLYAAKTEDGVKLGELDEEFVYETRIGDKILLGSFGWKILRQDKDNVIMAPADTMGARLPFWKGEIKGRSLRTSKAFGGILRGLAAAMEQGSLLEELGQLGLDQAAAQAAADFMKRQMQATGVMPDDRTIVVEHFRDASGMPQVMIHSLFGRRVNGPLSLLVQHRVQKDYGCSVGCVDEEDGFLLYSYGSGALPEGLLYTVDPDTAGELLEAILPVTPLFSMTFRYNAARALMMGIRHNGRQPLWLQRLRSTEMLNSLSRQKDHPLIRETRRECLEDQWDIRGLTEILHEIRSGLIAVREVYVEQPSPMSLPLQWQVEAAEMYEYYPTTQGIREAAYEELKQIDMMKPSRTELERLPERSRLPEDAAQLHSLMMMEGDWVAEELNELAQGLSGTDTCENGSDRLQGWLRELLEAGQVAYMEPGLWIAMEHRGEYEAALTEGETEAAGHIVRRMLYYRGGQTARQLLDRYIFPEKMLREVLYALVQQEDIIEEKFICGQKSAALQKSDTLQEPDVQEEYRTGEKPAIEEGAACQGDSVYYHAKRYSRARKATIAGLRAQAVTRQPESYAALMAQRAVHGSSSAQPLQQCLGQFTGQPFPAACWENILFARRIKGYRENLLDQLLAQGDYFWRMSPDGTICFFNAEEIDWNREPAEPGRELDEEEALLYGELQRRGASFCRALTGLPAKRSAQELLLSLAEKGMVCADSFVPVRQWLNQVKIRKSTARERVNARVMALSAGRWDIIRPLRSFQMEEWLEQLFGEKLILCRETYRKPPLEKTGGAAGAVTERNQAAEAVPGWGSALEVLRIWEYIGKVRRGYFVSGMSGAQFVLSQYYETVTQMLGSLEERGKAEEPSRREDIVWLNASDPAQIWGKALPHREDRAFLNVPGTAVALRLGEPAAVLERQGRVLRVFGNMEGIMEAFAQDYKDKRLFPDKKRLILKDFPQEAVGYLEAAGFMKEMKDYVLYR